jgi:hypothetical protein
VRNLNDIAEISTLREALLRITNLSGGCSIEDAKRIAVNALDQESPPPPAGKTEPSGCAHIS